MEVEGSGYRSTWTFRAVEPTFKQIAEHWRMHELRKEGIIGRKAHETAERDEHNLDKFQFFRAGKNGLAGSIKRPRLKLGSRSWRLHEGRKRKPLKWPRLKKSTR